MNNLYHITTYGCQMNTHESEKIAGILENMGYKPAPQQTQAGIVVFNTCCIRDTAENRAIGNIGALKEHKKQNKDCLIIVCGCMPQQSGKADKLIKTFPFIDIVLGTHNIENLAEYIAEKKASKLNLNKVTLQENKPENLPPIKREENKTANINIMYGCNNYCTYCIVPFVRGRERSVPVDIIIKQAKEINENAKHSSITLLGQNVNSYVCPNTKTTFAQLLKLVAQAAPNKEIQFLTSHPKDLTLDVILAIKENKNISRTVHLPVQSGSNQILAAMNRKYTSEHYMQVLSQIRQHITDVKITTDIIVGFPGETEQQFEQTCKLVKEAQFASAFIFMYNVRTGTVAATLDSQIPHKTKQARIAKLIEIQRKISNNIITD